MSDKKPPHAMFFLFFVMSLMSVKIHVCSGAKNVKIGAKGKSHGVIKIKVVHPQWCMNVFSNFHEPVVG